MNATYDSVRERQALLERLHRVEGQVRAIEQMAEDGRFCADLLTKVSAAAAALEAVGLEIIRGHVVSCVADVLATGDSDAREAKSRELLAAVERFTPSR